MRLTETADMKALTRLKWAVMWNFRSCRVPRLPTEGLAKSSGLPWNASRLAPGAIAAHVSAKLSVIT